MYQVLFWVIYKQTRRLLTKWWEFRRQWVINIMYVVQGDMKESWGNFIYLDQGEEIAGRG